MKSINNAGFTIIETMLFLGVSGLLITGILIGTGVSLNIQRYRDSVSSLQSFIQRQYSEVNNVIINDNTSPCGASPRTTAGQSNCVVLGRYITSNPNNRTTTLTVNNIIGSIPIGSIDTNDIEALKQHNILVSSVLETYEVEWGASIVTNTKVDMKFSILILKSPSSGAIRTFINNSDVVLGTVNVRNLLNSTPAPAPINTSALMCIELEGMGVGRKSAVLINRGATKGSDIQVLGDGSDFNSCT